jgi:uncharacterized membrane protein YphA (DoxX/SURF4 family)
MSAAALLWAAHIVTGGSFAVIGLRNIRNHAMISELLRSRGVPLPAVSATVGIAMQIGFGALLTTGRWPGMRTRRLRRDRDRDRALAVRDEPRGA